MRLRRWAGHALGAVRTYRDPLLRASEYYGVTQPGRDRLVELRNGLRFSVRLGTSDFGVLDDVFMRGVYNRALGHIEAGDVVIDIGAQCGAFALAAARRGARVLCYEPLGENAARLRENVALNGFENQVKVEELAVAPRRGMRTLYTALGDTGGATFFPAIHPEWSGSPNIQECPVDSVTLGDIFDREQLTHCACLKMDCEGAEYEIVASSGIRPLEDTRMIVLEYHPNGDIEALGRLLRERAFTVEIGTDPCILFARHS